MVGLVLCLILCLVLFYQIAKSFITMVNRACLVPTIILLSMLLIADIGLMSGIASYRQGVIPRISNDDANDPDGGLLLYGLVILPMIAVGMFIVIAMLTLPLICTPEQHPRVGQV